MNKKLQTMDSWTDVFNYISFSTSHSASLTTVAEEYWMEHGGGGWGTSSSTYQDGEASTPTQIIYRGDIKGRNFNAEYPDTYEIFPDNYEMFNITSAFQLPVVLPGSAIATRALMMLRFAGIENTNGVLSYLNDPSDFSFNGLSNRIRIDRCMDTGETPITVMDHIDGLFLPAGALKVPANGKSEGDTIVGNTDVARVISATGAYYIHCKAMFTTGLIKLHDAQFGLRVYFK